MDEMEDDFRVLAALRFEIGDGQHHELYERMARISWLVADAARAGNLYVQAFRYSGWGDTEAMNDFGLIHPYFPVNGHDCLCIELHDSPMSGDFTDARSLAGVTQQCEVHLSSGVPDVLNPQVGLASLNNDPTWTACLRDWRNSPVTKALRNVLCLPQLRDGFVAVSSGGISPPQHTEDIDIGLLAFWLNLAGPEPREISLQISRQAP